MDKRFSASRLWNPAAAINILLVCVMMACLWMDVGRWFAALLHQDFSWLVVFAFFASLEAQVTSRLLDRGMVLTRAWLQITLIEASALLLIMKAVTLWSMGADASMGEIRRWPIDFGNAFFSASFLFLSGFVFCAWMISRIMAADMIELESRQPARGVEAVLNPFEGKLRAQKNLSDLVMMLGAAIIVLGILATDIVPYAVRQLNKTQGLPPATGTALGPEILVFYLCGFGLLSFARLAIQRSGWEYERIPMRSDLPSRWIKYCLGFLVLVTVLAVLLPSDYSAVFLGAVLQVTFYVWKIIAVLLLLAMIPIAMLLSWWAKLFGIAAASVPYQPTPEPAGSMIPIAQPMEYVQAVFFWLVVIAFLLYLLAHLFQNRRVILDGFLRIRKPKWFTKVAEWIYRRVVRSGFRLAASIGQAVFGLRERLRGGSAVLPWERMARSTTPRGRVLAYYLSTVRRGAEAGLPRLASQTPLDYAQVLESQVPDSEKDLKVLTASFQDARYSLHPVGDFEASLARQAWLHLRRILQPGKVASSTKKSKDTKLD
jgi:hypothetical protein